MRPPKQLSNKSLHAAWRYLTHKDLDLLGDWRFDKDLLVDLNRKLVSHQVGIIDNFFVPSLAEMLHNEVVQKSNEGWFGHDFGDPFDCKEGWLGPLGMKDYNKHFDPGERCVIVERAYGSPAFFRYHKYRQPEGVKNDTLPLEELPGRLAVQKLFRQRKWIKGWTILLTGTDKGIDRLSMSDPDFREYRAGDYINAHTDEGSDKRDYHRKLCFNYWSPSPDWNPEWGGSFVWCSVGVQNPQGTGGIFPAAFRAPTRYNQVGMFIPTPDSFHIVDLVGDAADPSRHRFSFTSWLQERSPPPGSAEL
jgi:hypothetical protein